MDESIQNQICKVWEVEQEILDVFHKICVENHLKYSLTYGTLIGAIRHKGFIPWDDDIDVMMPRDDYNKFIEIWYSVAPDGYILQNHDNTPSFEQSFTKIRKDHTAFVESEKEISRGFHMGIFIDIFPCDRVPAGSFQRKMQFFAYSLNILCTRMFKRKMIFNTDRFTGKWNTNKDLYFVLPCTIRDSKLYYPPNLFEKVQFALFNGKQYCITSDYDDFLTRQYGDYMKLPPKEEQVWAHHPILVDFEHNYDELNK